MLVVLTHEEPHPAAVPENVALDKLTVVNAVTCDNMHKFKYYKTLQDKIVQILQDDNQPK
jgi:hypothetical protein